MLTLKVTCYWLIEECNISIKMKSLFESASAAAVAVIGLSIIPLLLFTETSSRLCVRP